MVMQVSCQSPGCVPLETCVTIVFPRPPSKKKKKLKRPKSGATCDPSTEDKAAENEKDEIPSFPEPLLPNLPESQTGGSFKTRILKPLSEVTMDDVLDALPPSFEGGRRTWESVCMKARDVVFAQIGQIVGNGEGDEGAAVVSAALEGKDLENRKLIAEYLQVCLQEYIDRGCVAPNWGEPFPPLDIASETSTKYNYADDGGRNRAPSGDENDAQSNEKIEKRRESNGENDIKTAAADEQITTKTESMSMDEKFGKGNFVFRRPLDAEVDCTSNRKGE